MAMIKIPTNITGKLLIGCFLIFAFHAQIARGHQATAAPTRILTTAEGTLIADNSGYTDNTVQLNSGAPAESRNQQVTQNDPYGFVMTAVALGVVLCALILLYITFRFVARIYPGDIRKRFLKKKGKSADEVSLPDVHDTTGELGAAVALALYFYQNQLHDNENTILTIEKAAKVYSPWSSKIYGVRKPLK